MKVGDIVKSRHTVRVAKIIGENSTHFTAQITKLPSDYFGISKVGQIINVAKEAMDDFWELQ